MVTLDSKLFWKAYKEANEVTEGDEVEVIEVIDPSLKHWLENNIRSQELLELILEYPFYETVQLCASYFYGPEEIKNSTEMYQTINERYVVVGSSSCGDWIAIPRNGWDSVGYISHDEFGYDESDLLKYCGVSSSIGAFYYNTWHKKDYPCDYYDAIKYIKNNA